MTIKIKVKTEYVSDLVKEVNKQLKTNYNNKSIKNFSKFWNDDSDWYFQFEAKIIPIEEYNDLKTKSENWDNLIEKMKKDYK